MAVFQIGGLPASESAPALGVPLIKQQAVKIVSGATFRDAYAISQGQKPAMRGGSAAAGGGGGGGAPAPAPPPAAAPPPPPVKVLPPSEPLQTPQPFASGGGGGGGGGIGPFAQSSLTQSAPGVEPASAVTASVDMPPWMWAAGAVLLGGVALGGIYLATRPAPRRKAA